MAGEMEPIMTQYYGAKTTSGEIMIMSISDLEPTCLQGPGMAEFLSNIDMWEPFADDFDDPTVAEWLNKEELASLLNR